MGYELRRELRKVLGPDITGLQRAVALEITDDANDRTRESYASLEDLALWTGAKDTNVIRNALKRLAAAGWEFRVPIGQGKDGRVLYAVPGRRMTFRVPEFEGVATAPPKGEPPLPQGVAVAPSEGATARSEGAPATPFSSLPSIPSSLSSGEQARRPTVVAGAEEEREIKQPTDNPAAEAVVAAYVEAIHRPVSTATRTKLRQQAAQLLADGFPAAWLADRARELAERGWTDLEQHCDRSTVPTTRVATDSRTGWCGKCLDPNHRMFKDPARDNELVECETCHPAAVARRRRAQETGEAA